MRADMERDAGENPNEIRWEFYNGPLTSTCSNCEDKPATEDFGNEFCSQTCFDEWGNYLAECAAFERDHPTFSELGVA